MGESTRFMTITFNSGNKKKFEFSPLSDDLNVLTGKLDKIFSAGSLMVKCEDRIHIFPLASVESIEVGPVPDKAPGFVINALRELS